MSTNRVDVGKPPKDFNDWTSTNVCFHGFANLSTTRDIYVESPEFSCLGHQWNLRLYPGGKAESEEGYIAVGLANRSNTNIKIQWSYSIRNEFGKEAVYGRATDEFGVCGCQAPQYSVWCTRNFSERSTIMKSLVDGSLAVEVRMRFPDSSANYSTITQFIPTNPINKNVLDLFLDEETADVLFELGGEQQTTKGKRKRANLSTTNFYAHRLILQKSAPTLYEMCGRSDEGGISTVSITDVKPEIFKFMMYYTYGGKLSDEDLKNNAKDIINACDKYGIVYLKLEAEASYVKSSTISMENMMDNLLYADSKNLALLKEAVMDYIVKNKDDIIGKVSFDNVPGALMSDLLTAVSRGEAGNDTNGDSTNYNKMRVGTLRKMLDEKGLDVDGSRESMIALLKEHSA